MKAMILAAGRGDRMRPLTDVCPKPLLKAGGIPLIEHHINKLRKAGIIEIVINHAYLGQQIEDYLQDGQALGVAIRYSHEDTALETGGGIFQALPLLGDAPFLVVNADVWCDIDYGQLLQSINAQSANAQSISGLAHLLMINNPVHNPQGDFYYTNGRLSKSGEEKLTYSGIGIYYPQLFAECVAGAFPLAPLLRKAISDNLITATYYNGYWLDVGTPERLIQLNRHLEL